MISLTYLTLLSYVILARIVRRANEAIAFLIYSAEPSWLAKGFSSPYYTDKHRVFQKAVRKFVSDVMYQEAQECEETGRRISQEVVDKMWYVTQLPLQILAMG